MINTLLEIISQIKQRKILVVGDCMLDGYIYGDALRISPEAPVPVVKVINRHYACGGAGSVAADIAALGAACSCIGYVGKDATGRQLLDLLKTEGVDVSHIFEIDKRPTIKKERLIGLAQHRHRQQLLRIDEEVTNPLSSGDQERIKIAYKKLLSEVDIVCLEDYGKGLLTEELCVELINAAKEAGKKVLIDPASSGSYKKYAGAYAITPNRKEASGYVKFSIETPEDAEKAASIISEELNIDMVVITLDKEGAFLKTSEFNGLVPTVPRTVYDVTGAGDMVLAMLAVSLATGCDTESAVMLANIAGGLEVEKFGATTLSTDEILHELYSQSKDKSNKYRTIGELDAQLEIHRKKGDTVVFTNGCFDVLHSGHTHFLDFCKQQGDILVVGLNSDSSVKKNKGPSRPINNQHDRITVLSALESVDYITLFEDKTPKTLIEQVRPTVLVKGQDWADKGVVGREFVEANGGKVVLAELIEGKSSTATINKMQELDKKNEK